MSDLNLENKILSVSDLDVTFDSRGKEVHALKGVSFDLQKGEVLAIVGESGSGKSVTSRAILQILETNSKINSGEILFQSRENGVMNLTNETDENMRKIRGGNLAIIFQDSMSSLDPTKRVGHQVAEGLILHGRVPEGRKGRKEAWGQAVQWLGKVGIPEPEKAARRYPHQFSGGQRQRISIAGALITKPDVLIADEPTTALDVTVQAQILDLLHELKQEIDISIIFITHDLSVVSQFADRVVVMRHGEVLETASTRELFANPKNDYSKELLAAASLKHVDTPVDSVAFQESSTEKHDPNAIFSLSNAFVEFANGKNVVKAVDGVTFDIKPGEVLGLVGESGSGKTTIGRILAGVQPLTSGDLKFEGVNLNEATREQKQLYRRSVQMVFQDPSASLDPRMRIEDIILEGAINFGLVGKTKEDKEAKVLELLDVVGLEQSHKDRYPHELSGGQKQRVGIARALATQAKFLICDEPTSALDVSIQAQIIDLLQELRGKIGLSMLFITHDLNLAPAVSDRIAVMQKGVIVEIGESQELINNPQHPYTKQLLSAVPKL
jgi:peptide/nickel transport system ATP-binding protein